MQKAPSGSQPSGKNVIDMTESGFSPNNLTIKRGDVVTFVNKDTITPHWPASGPHPVHTGYPLPGGCIGSKFDSCRWLSPGDSWSFQFNISGAWSYHDHLSAGYTGTIVVSE